MVLPPTTSPPYHPTFFLHSTTLPSYLLSAPYLPTILASFLHCTVYIITIYRRKKYILAMLIKRRCPTKVQTNRKTGHLIKAECPMTNKNFDIMLSILAFISPSSAKTSLFYKFSLIVEKVGGLREL